MAPTAPPSPAGSRELDAVSNASRSPSRPSPSKLLRLYQLSAERASSLSPRRPMSPAKGQTRPRLNQYYTIDHAVSLLQSKKNIVILTGAGISTSLGVPDFRSSQGVYSLLDGCKYNDPQELFHIDNFKEEPQEFFRQAAKVFPSMQGLVPRSDTASEDGQSFDFKSVPRYGPTHAFISMLEAKGKLLTNYTQNIDGLETAAGVSSSKLIQCHGTLSTASCMSCGKQVTARKYMPIVCAGNIPFCKCSQEPDPIKRNPTSKKSRRGRTGQKKRKYDDLDTSDEDDYNSGPGFPKGLLKPDMTFFGEHVAETYATRLDIDTMKVDLLVIIGTSLKVAPVNQMLLKIPSSVPQIWISKERCTREGVKVDIELLGECDLIVQELCRRAGWTVELKERQWTAEKAQAKPKPSNKATTSSVESTQKSRSRSKDRKDSVSVSSKSRPASPVKAAPSEHNLQIRPKEEPDAPAVNPTVTPALDSAPIIRLNDAELPKDEPPTSKADQPSLPPPGTGERDKDVKGVQNPVRAPDEPCRVIIELEEGTRSRWYVRRKK
ncbi:hypothetical protein B0A52_03950 [Exophiala mesophila]|uniref:Deacetylase sirtuin-type domain-containing protein n=1 Tax=Exophiala mesophila TaxID=212818 RepID=A0A438N7Y2_EXOME|nr:hypothetical protein B0A52_03950 [Exophiala mesophila]